jgi:homoserine dehydrogenase
VDATNDLKIFFIGFGNVGRSLYRRFFERFGGHKIIGALSSRGGVIVEGKEEARELYKLSITNSKLDKHSKFVYGIGIEDLYPRIERRETLAFVTIPPSYINGLPNLQTYKSLIEHGVHTITADKTGLALAYKTIIGKACEEGVFYGYRATVSAGTPSIDVIRGIRGRKVKRIDAVLNACTNYILSLIEKGYSWEKAIEKAINEKIAEPDPRVDTHGWDPAAKITILANEFGMKKTLKDVDREPLDIIGEERIRMELEKGRRVKYIATIDFEDEKLSVKPMILEAHNPLSSVSGIYNALYIEIEDDYIMLRGPAGPAWRTAEVMLTDFKEFLLKKQYERKKS